MLFADVVGQGPVKDRLLGMATAAQVPHAMMLLGPEGNGGLPIALALAQYIHCENKTPHDSCGVCPSCQKHQKNIHPDIYFTYPVVTRKSNEAPVSTDYIKEWRVALAENPYMNANDWLQSIGAENRQGNITVRECHEIIRHMSLKTYEAAQKIQIIWLAEYLRDAGNTLLKIIEEPADNTFFILIVENIEQVLTTVISRTQLIKVNAIEDADIQQALVSRFKQEEGVANKIARISDGNFNAAMGLAAGDENINDKLLHRWLVCCFNLKLKPSGGNAVQLVEWVEEMARIGRENQKIFIKYALFFLRECAAIGLIGKSEKLDTDEIKFATGLAAKLGVNEFETLMAILNKVYYHIERNANPKILFLSTSFKIASVFKHEPVEVEN